MVTLPSGSPPHRLASSPSSTEPSGLWKHPCFLTTRCLRPLLLSYPQVPPLVPPAHSPHPIREALVPLGERWQQKPELWGCVYHVVFTAFIGWPQKGQSALFYWLSRSFLKPFPIILHIITFQFLPLPFELPAFFFFRCNILWHTSHLTTHMCLVTKLSKDSVTSAVKHQWPVLPNTGVNLYSVHETGFRPHRVVWPPTVTISPRVLCLSLIKLPHSNAP